MKNIFFLLIFSYGALAQPNCNVYLYEGDTLQYEACKLSEKFNNYYQFETKGIAILDSCIAMCPYFAYAYYEKGVPFLKAGNFLMWDKYISLAVKFAPTEYLSNSASCRGKFFADYAGAIEDIERLESLVNYDIGYVHDGAYHLDAYKALCHKALGNHDEAIILFEEHIAKRPDDIGLYDLIHLGVCYYKIGKFEKAIFYLKKQIEINDLAENQFYLAKCYQAIQDPILAKKTMEKAYTLYKKDQKMADGYSTLEDQIFLGQLESEINSKYFKGN